MPLRYLIPALLISILILNALFSYFISVRDINDNVFNTNKTLLNSKAQILQSAIEYLHQQDNIEDINQVFSVLGSDPQILHAMFLNHKNIVINSIHRKDIGKPFQKAIYNHAVATKHEHQNTKHLKSDFTQIRKALRNSIEVKEETITAIYPVLLGSSKGSLRSDLVGLLLIQKDLSEAFRQTEISLQQQSIPLLLFDTVLIISLILFLNYVLSRRLLTITDVTQKIAHGDLSSRLNKMGFNDELGKLSHSINIMADEIENDQLRIKKERDFATTLIDTAPVIILLLDKKGIIQHVNPYFEKLTGYSLEEVRGKEWFKTFLPEPVQDNIRTIFHKAWGVERTHGNINPVVTRSGHEIEIEWYDELIVDSEGNPSTLLAIGQDVSERIKTENNLRIIEQRLNEAQRMAKIGSWELDLVKNYLWWSDENFRIFGFEPGKFGASYDAFLETVHPDDREMVNQAYTSSLETKEPYSILHRLKMKDGSIKYVHEECETLYNDAGQAFLSKGTTQDVTETVLAEQDQYRLLTALNASTNEIYLLNNDDRTFHYASPAARHNLGYSMEQLRTMTPLDIGHYKDKSDFKNRVTPLLEKEKKQLLFESVHYRADGSTYPVEVRLQYIEKLDPPMFLAVITDITERKLAEAALRQERDSLRQILDSQFGFVTVMTTDGMMVEINQGPLTLIGLSRYEVLGQYFWEIDWLQAENKSQAQAAVAAAAKGETIRDEIVAHFPGIGNRDVDSVFYPILNSQGQVINVVAFGIDITERRQAEETLRDNEERLRLVLNATNDGVWDWNILTHEDYLSSRWKEILGYRDDELENTESTFFNLIHPDDQARVSEAVNQHFKDRTPYNTEIRMRHKDGNYRWIFSRGEAIRDEAGQPVRMVGTITDITEQKQQEQQKQQANTRLRKQQSALLTLAQYQQMAMNSAQRIFNRLTETSALTLVVDRVSVWLFNDEHTSITCMDLYEVLSKRHSSGLQLSIQDYPNYFAALEKNREIVADDALNHAETSEFSENYLKPLGISSMLDAPLRDGTGRVLGVICYEHTGTARKWFQDEQGYASSTADMISLSLELFERRKTEQELRLYQEKLELMVKQRTEELESTNKELEAFTYSVSHDLRAPLRGIDGFSKLLLDKYKDKLDDSGQDYLGRVRNGAQRMGQLINDVLQLSRANKEEISLQPVNLSHIAGQSIDEIRQSEPERQIEIKIPATLQVESDPKMMRMVLDNLLGNAWKFSCKVEQPSIEFGCLNKADESIYFVRDNGAGFDMQYADKLFRVFQRLHSAEEYPGTGVGLSIVARLIKRLGGRIWAESEVGKGATFYFTLSSNKQGNDYE